MYRDSNLLKLAQGEKCLLEIAHNCLGTEGSTTVAAHSNFGVHGKGRGIKAEDCYSVWACHRCHTLFDSGNIDKQKKIEHFIAAFAQQLVEWNEISESPTIREWKREAARKALEYVLQPNRVLSWVNLS